MEWNLPTSSVEMILKKQVGDTVVIPEYGGVTLNFEKEETRATDQTGHANVLGIRGKTTNLPMERNEELYSVSKLRHVCFYPCFSVEASQHSPAHVLAGQWKMGGVFMHHDSRQFVTTYTADLTLSGDFQKKTLKI